MMHYCGNKRGNWTCIREIHLDQKHYYAKLDSPVTHRSVGFLLAVGMILTALGLFVGWFGR